MTELITQEEAVHSLEAQRALILDLAQPLEAEELTRPGLGGGEWSVKDLLGHLESWEEHVLAALDAWQNGERAPVDVATYGEGVNSLNAREVARRAALSLDEQIEAGRLTHGRLIETLRAMTPERWDSPATSRARKPLGQRIGSILTGKGGPFRHDEAHLAGLRAWVEELRFRSRA